MCSGVELGYLVDIILGLVLTGYCTAETETCESIGR